MRQVMKALVLTTINLKDLSILHLDPDHPSDNRARFPIVYDEDDVARLERENLAVKWDEPIPELDTPEAKAEQARLAEREAQGFGQSNNSLAGDKPKGRKRNRGKAAAAAKPATGRRGATKPGPGVETEAEAEAAADLVDGVADQDDPTLAPGSGPGTE